MSEHLSAASDYTAKIIRKASGIDAFQRISQVNQSNSLPGAIFNKLGEAWWAGHQVLLPFGTESLFKNMEGNKKAESIFAFAALLDFGFDIATIILATSGKPELAVGIKTAYNTGAAIVPDAVRLAAAKASNLHKNITSAF